MQYNIVVYSLLYGPSFFNIPFFVTAKQLLYASQNYCSLYILGSTSEGYNMRPDDLNYLYLSTRADF